MSVPGTLRRARWFLVAMHVPAVGIAWVGSTFGTDGGPSWNPIGVAALSLALVGLQLRHSFAAARRERPRGWPLSFFALIALVYVPMIWLTWNWSQMQCLVVASTLMMLRGSLAPAVVAILVLVSGTLGAAPHIRTGWIAAVGDFIYVVLTLLVAGVALFGAARLVSGLRELQATRAELAGLAVVQERLRISRDLHDLLGQTLSAIALKGDFALRLLHRDPPAARTEISSLTGMARDALHDMRSVARDQLVIALNVEAEGAAAVLSAAGVKSTIELDLTDLSPPLRRTLAWAVGEGVTNVLRHSRAQTCSIIAGRSEGMVKLEIVNDGAGTVGERGGGLTDLAARTLALSGTLTAVRTTDGRFRLTVQLPEEAE
ncbi:sensor histidine kinase [Catenulispora sp. GAS73]|uniref:sensor histidine kinase n=1 Tax=Catenulispora sp. GAS73 TaxID=3156269 RepID=UPI003517694E